eukprot:m.46613 g.46613  ORF g.46613 m.46613 type:complete len:77 (-) comp20293_c0_seq1:163-393(-)
MIPLTIKVYGLNYEAVQQLALRVFALDLRASNNSNIKHINRQNHEICMVWCGTPHHTTPHLTLAWWVVVGVWGEFW